MEKGKLVNSVIKTDVVYNVINIKRSNTKCWASMRKMSSRVKYYLGNERNFKTLHCCLFPFSLIHFFPLIKRYYFLQNLVRRGKDET